MIVYQSSALEFRESVDNNKIIYDIENKFIEKFGRKVSAAEKSSWNNSLKFMETIVRNSKVSDDCGVLIEYGIPSTSKRIDFIISGCDKNGEENFVIIELKQWSRAEATLKENIVKSFVGGNIRELIHPSYQAWSYRQHLSDMNEAIYSNQISGHSCAYLHNYAENNPEPLKLNQYEEIIQNAPVFFSGDNKKLQDFLYRHVGKGKGQDILYKIENGRIKPSKKLIDCVSSMFEGNKEFVLLDEQEIAYQSIVDSALNSKGRKTIIVKGGPGTGKSVVSINAFAEILRSGRNIKFVAPNASFRSVIIETLSKNKKGSRQRLSGLFSGSGSFVEDSPKSYEVIVVDEAHRLKGAGTYMYKGINQVADIIKASETNVFFVDDNQRIRPNDIGSVEEIKRIAKMYSSEIFEMELEAQYRCAGAEGFINWIDHTLQIRETANYDGWDNKSYEFEILPSPNEVYNKIKAKSEAGNKARMLAGYAWPWTSEKNGNRNGEICDVCIPEHSFEMPWNSRAVSTTWAIKGEGINQVGCIHTSQGLEFDYIGVIIGKDLQFDPESYKVFASYENNYDSAGKKKMKKNPDKFTELIKNTYKVLLSRGMKGCYVYCCDEELESYIKSRMPEIIPPDS